MKRPKIYQLVDQLPKLEELYQLSNSTECAVFGPNRGFIKAVQIADTMYQLPASWGAETVEQAHCIKSRAISAGLTGRTAGGVAASLVRDEGFTGKQSYQLPTRYREIASDYHVGPMGMCRHEVTDCTLYDIRKAYLWALSMPLPVRDTYRALTPDTVTAMAAIEDDRRGGFIDCTVHVPDNGMTIGPLPVRRKIGSKSSRFKRTMPVWPVGTFRGTWPLSLVRNAVQSHGATIVRVNQLVTCHVSRWGLRLYDYLSNLVSSDKVLGKAIYTSLWSRFTPSVWYTGQVLPNGIKWNKPSTKYKLSNKIHPRRMIMRPDVSAYVSAYNIRTMVNALNSLDRTTVAGWHVDSIHTSSRVVTGSRYGDFKAELNGDVYYDRTGSYAYTDCNGEILKETGGSLFGSPLFRYSSRRFYDTDLITYTTSEPLLLTEEPTSTDIDKSVYSNKWTSRGWYRAD